MSRPQVSWLPVCHLSSAISTGYPPIEDWVTRAYVMGLRSVALDYDLLPSRQPEVLRALGRRLDRHGLGVSMVACLSDFTHPDPDVRDAQAARVTRAVEVARTLGANCLQVTCGREHRDVPRDDALVWCTESISRLADGAKRVGIQLAVPNHYGDPRWHETDFAAAPETFLEVVRGLEDTDAKVSFSAANPLMTAGDPVALLQQVVKHVCQVLIADRLPGQFLHSVAGEGNVDLDGIFQCLSAAGYEGFLTLDDNLPRGGDATQRSLGYLRAKIAQWWR